MSDTTLNRIVSSGTQAQRLAFTPAPATPASGPNPLYIWNETDTGAVYHSPNGAAWVRAGPTVAEMNAAIAAASGSGGTIPDSVVSGCGVVYSGTGLTFNMSAGSFYLGETLLTATAQSVTLATADATNPRIDVLYVDSSGVFGKITGVAAVSPSQPTVDPTSQLYLTFVNVPATATSIGGITNENIYLEGVEWTGTTSGSGFTLNSTNNPFAGTKDIEGTAVTAASYVKLVRSSAMAFDGNGNLTLEIRSKATWTSTHWLTLQWYLAGVAKGAAVSLKTGTFGFNSSFISGYQLIIINKNQFAVPAGANVDELRIVDVGGSIGFYLDNIILQNTGTSTGGGTSITSLSTGISTVDSNQSTSLSQISSSLSGAISSTSSLSAAVSTVDSNQSTSLSRISSSLSGAISSTSSLSTAVSTVISGSISTVTSSVNSLSTAVGSGSAGALILLEQHTASNSASLDFTTGITSTYDEYIFEMVNVLNATQSAVPQLRMSTDGGSTYDSGANYQDYYHSRSILTFSGNGSATDTKIQMNNNGHVNTFSYGIGGQFRLFDPLSASQHKAVSGSFVACDGGGSGAISDCQFSGRYMSTTAVNALRFMFSTGNITSGTIRMYGIAK